MAIVLGPNQYGKAETRVVRIYRDGGPHEIRDLNVSTLLRGAFDAAHTRGDQASVLPTDSQKNTCFARARENGVGAIEDYALDLARHFTADIGPVTEARIDVTEYRWERVNVAGRPQPHTFTRASSEVRTTAVTVQGEGPTRREWVVSGLDDLVILKTTGSEFAGFLEDEYTTLAPTHDRILATSLTARWRYAAPLTDWDEGHARIRQILVEEFAGLHSLGPAADAVRHGPGGAGGPRGGGGDQAVRAQPPSLPGRPGPVRPGQPGRGVPRRRPPLWPDPVRGPA